MSQYSNVASSSTTDGGYTLSRRSWNWGPDRTPKSEQVKTVHDPQDPMPARYITWAGFRIDNGDHLQFGFATRHDDGHVHSSCTGLEVMSTWTMSGRVRPSGIDSNFWKDRFPISTHKIQDVVVELNEGLQTLLNDWIDGNIDQRTWQLRASGYNASVWCMVDIHSAKSWTSQNGRIVASYTWTLSLY